MVCFSDDKAVNQVLNRSPNLCKSGLYGHIYVKRDLPRNQRPSVNKRSANIFAEAERGGRISETPAVRNQLTKRVHNADAEGERTDGLSDIDSVSDFSDTDTDQDRSSDSENDTLVESDEMVTWDETSRNEEEEQGGTGGIAPLVHTPATRFTSTANIVLLHALSFLGMQGTAVTENSVSGEANPNETAPSGNEEGLGGGVTR